MPKSPTRSSPNWRSPLALPKNAAAQRRYSRINVLILWGALIERGFAGRNWLTFRQACGLGGNVRKHASVAAFEGYAGSSKSGFRAEVKAQRALGQIDDILDYFDDRRAGGSPSGPAGPRIARTLDAAGDTLGPLPAMIADRARLRTLRASLARTLHVGPLADCFFDSSTALCLKRTTASDRTTPLIALCEPTRCPNACLTQRHRPVWERAAADAALLLREKRLPAPQRVVLQQELARIQAVLAGIGPRPDLASPGAAER